MATDTLIKAEIAPPVKPLRLTDAQAEVVADLRGWGYLRPGPCTIAQGAQIWPTRTNRDNACRRTFDGLMRRLNVPQTGDYRYGRYWQLPDGLGLLTAYEAWYTRRGWKLEESEG